MQKTRFLKELDHSNTLLPLPIIWQTCSPICLLVCSNNKWAKVLEAANKECQNPAKGKERVSSFLTLLKSKKAWPKKCKKAWAKKVKRVKKENKAREKVKAKEKERVKVVERAKVREREATEPPATNQTLLQPTKAKTMMPSSLRFINSSSNYAKT